jgi:hypothetical protein
MIYIILTIIGIALLVIGIKAEYGGDQVCIVSGIVILSIVGIVSFCLLGVGIISYPDLLAKQEQIKILEKGIEDVRKASYDTKENSVAMVNGSLDNMKQSTNLSEYIRMVYEERANYNKDLTKCQYYEKNTLMFWVADGAFISS